MKATYKLVYIFIIFYTISACTLNDKSFPAIPPISAVTYSNYEQEIDQFKSIITTEIDSTYCTALLGLMNCYNHRSQYDSTFYLKKVNKNCSTKEKIKVNVATTLSALKGSLTENQKNKALDSLQKELNTLLSQEKEEETEIIRRYLEVQLVSKEKKEETMLRQQKWLTNALNSTHFGKIYPLISNAFLLDIGMYYHGKIPEKTLIAYYDHIIKISERLNDGYYPIWAYYQKGRIALENENYRDAVSFNEKVEFYHRQLQVWDENHSLTAGIYNNLSLSYKGIGDYERALIYMNKVIRIYERYCKKDACAFVLSKQMNKASILKDGNFPKKAIQLYETMLPQLQSLNYADSILMSTENNLGNAYLKLKNYEQAERYLLSAHQKKIEKFSEDSRITAKSYFNLGRVYLKQNKTQLAQEHLLKGIHLFNEMGIRGNTLISNAYDLLSQTYLQIEQKEKALVLLDSAIVNLGITKKAAENFDFYNSLSDYHLLSPLSAKAELIAERYRENEEEKDRTTATQLFEASSSLIDSLRYALTTEESKIEFTSLARSSYLSAIKHHLTAYENEGRQEDKTAAFSYAEHSKYILLNESIAFSDAKFSLLPDSLLNLEKKIRADKAEKKKSLFFLQQSKQEIASIKELQDEIFVLDNRLLDLENTYANKYPEYTKLQQATFSNIEQVQEKIKEYTNTTLVSYHLSDTDLQTFVINGNSFHIFQQEIDDSFFTALNELINLISENPKHAYASLEWKANFVAYHKASSLLSEKLLLPILEQIATDNIVIIPDRELGYLPFEILPIERFDLVNSDSSNYRAIPFLFSQKEVRYEYSTTLFAQSSKELSNNQYIGFAPTYDTSVQLAENASDSINLAGNFRNRSQNRSALSPLKYNKEEVKEAATFFTGKTYLNDDANKRTFLQEAREAGIIHLSMHGIVNDQNPLFSRLEFTATDTTDQHRLYAYELYNQRFKANLAVLSACETGLGKLNRGEGIMSLSRAFKFTGCSNIVMSLWSVNDKSSKQIMVKFFQYLSEGENKAHALQKARKDYFQDAAAPNTHPFYWAPFVLIGDNQNVITTGGSWF